MGSDGQSVEPTMEEIRRQEEEKRLQAEQEAARKAADAIRVLDDMDCLSAAEVVVGMRDHPENEEIQHLALATLASLLVRDAANEAAVSTDEAVEALVLAMESNPEHSQLISNAFFILRRLALKPTTKTKVVQTGGWRIVKMMDKHISNSSLQEHGCAILHSCASNQIQNKWKLNGNLNATDVSVRAMAAHAENEGVQEAGCMALRVLASTSKTAEGSGVVQIMKAMQQFPNSVAVQDQGCWALSSIAYTSPASQTTIAELGGIESVMEAFRLHPTVSDVQGHACWAVRNLAAAHPENQRKIAAAGGIEAVVSAMASYPSCHSLQHQAVWSLRDLLADVPENRYRANTPENMKVINATTDAFGNEGNMTTVCRELTTLLATASDMRSSG